MIARLVHRIGCPALMTDLFRSTFLERQMASIKSPIATLLSFCRRCFDRRNPEWNGGPDHRGRGHLAGNANGAGGAARLGAASSTLTVTRPGSGGGTVTSNVGAINCGAACSDTYNDGTVITLSAAPAAGSQFTGWLGPCSGSGTCQTPNGATTAAATFAPIPRRGSTSTATPPSMR
jgi:hypothetical protein